VNWQGQMEEIYLVAGCKTGAKQEGKKFGEPYTGIVSSFCN